MTRDDLIHWLENDDISGTTPVRIRDIRGVVQEIVEIRVVTDGLGNRSLQLRGGDPL